MKVNWYTLASFVVVCAAIYGAHTLGLSSLQTTLVSCLFALAPALLPAAVSKPAPEVPVAEQAPAEPPVK